jgi:hypothetical protein
LEQVRSNWFLWIICQFHALVTMCQLYSIRLAGEENRKCRVSRAFDYMSIWFYKICERKWGKLHDTTWHSKILSLHFVLSCLPPLRKRSMQVSCKHSQTQQKVTAVLLAVRHWTWLEGLPGRVCCCDSEKKKQKNRSRTAMGAPSVSSCTTYSNIGAGASRHRTDFAYKTCQPQLTLRMKPWHTKWESNKETANNYQGDYFYCWFHCRNQEVMVTSSPSNRVPSPLRSSCTFRNHQISYVSGQLWTAATTQPRQKLRLSKTFKLTLTSPSKSTFPAPTLLLQQTSGKSTRTSASGDS